MESPPFLELEEGENLQNPCRWLGEYLLIFFNLMMKWKWESDDWVENLQPINPFSYFYSKKQIANDKIICNLLTSNKFTLLVQENKSYLYPFCIIRWHCQMKIANSGIILWILHWKTYTQICQVERCYQWDLPLCFDCFSSVVCFPPTIVISVLPLFCSN